MPSTNAAPGTGFLRACQFRSRLRRSGAITGVTRDLSTGGIFLYTDSRISEGSELEMVLILPAEITNSEKQWVCCQASWCGWKRIRIKEVLELPPASAAWTFCQKSPAKLLIIMELAILDMRPRKGLRPPKPPCAQKFCKNVKFLIHCITFGAIMLALELLWFKEIRIQSLRFSEFVICAIRNREDSSRPVCGWKKCLPACCEC